MKSTLQGSTRGGAWRARFRDGRHSVQQHIRTVKDCTDEELDAKLAEAAKEFPGATWQMLRVLLHQRESADQRSWSLSDAYNRLASMGFEMGHHLITHQVFHSKLTRLMPACFELVLGMWDKLDDKTKSWLSVRFVEYWRSPTGAELTSDFLQRTKCIWKQEPPTQNQRLAPARACGLAWSREDTEAMMTTHVDFTGDMRGLVMELVERDMLSASLLLHDGVITGLLLLNPQMASEKLLSGEFCLVKPQASLALKMAGALALWDREFTTQNVKHLRRFFEVVCEVLPQATNAMYQMIDPLMKLVAKLKPEDRPPFCKLVSALYMDKNDSRIAEIPHPNRSATNQHRCLHIRSYIVFLESAISCLSLAEITSSVYNSNPFLDRSFCDRLHVWALAQLDEPQTAHQLLSFLRSWVVAFCYPEQVLAFWLKAVDTVRSWSFLLVSLNIAAPGCKKDKRMYSRVIELLKLEPHASIHRRDAVLKTLESIWPHEIAEQYGINKWLQLSKRSLPGTSLVERETFKLSAGSVQVNDSLQPERELGRIFGEHPTMHKTKTKEELALLVDWVRNLDASIFCETELAERMSQILCEKWSDQFMLLQLCETFTSKLFECVESTLDCKVLIKFIAKCPNLGHNKQEFLTKQLGNFSGCSAGRIELSVLHPLLAAQSVNANALVGFLHALRCTRVTGETQNLLFDLLAKEETSAKRAQLLRTCRFSTPPGDEPLDECIDCIGAEAWSDVDAWALPSDESDSQEAAIEQQDISTTKQLTDPDLPLYALYRRFGPGGEAIIHEYLQTAKPTQLVELFADAPSFRTLCRSAMRSWRLAECAADQVQSLLDVVEWFPEVYGRCAPLVWKVGEEAQVRRLLAMTWTVASERLRFPPDLDALPRKWWHCLHWPSLKDTDLTRAVEAGVEVPLEEVGFAQRSWSAQVTLLDANGNGLSILADFAPQVVGPIEPYLERIFELIPESEKLLTDLGDGVENDERRASGWNKIVHRLLLGMRERIKDGNMLHTDEQLLLYRGCAVRYCDNTNSSLLADLMESKMIDPQHIAPLVTFVLDTHNFKNIVRDSALRAMMRLPKEERDALHRSLFERAKAKLPLQVIFSLVVTQLDEGVLPLVIAQLEQLSVEEWNELLILIKDANPVGKDPHTYPRSLSPEFNERFLLRYLIDEVPKRDQRFFLLFVATTKRSAIPRYLIGVLVAQRHALDSLLLESLTHLTVDEFRDITEFIRPEEWPSRLDWVMTRVEKSGNSCEMMKVVLDIIAHQVFQNFNQLLALILKAPQTVKTLLKIEDVRTLLRERIPNLEHGGEKSESRALWVSFFRESWLAGAHYTADELTDALHLTQKKTLTEPEVLQLGVDLSAYKLLIQMVPAIAIKHFGFKVLEEEPAFASTLSLDQLLQIKQLSSKNDAHWVTCRKVIGQVEPASALRLAVILFKHSREDRDLELVSTAYRSVDNFTRKQTWLPLELGDLWKKFGDKIQRIVIDPVVPPQHTISLEVSRVAGLARVPSTASWEVVEEADPNMADLAISIGEF